MDAQEELAFLRSVAASQLQTIKALTLGCEKYGLTETTPVVRHLAAQDDEIERLRAELAECKDLLRIASDFVERLPGHEGRTAFTDRIDAALAAKESEK